MLCSRFQLTSASGQRPNVRFSNRAWGSSWFRSSADRSRGSRFSSQSGWLLSSGAAARMHGIRVWRASLLVALEAQQTFSASSIPSSAWDDPARIGLWCGSSGHAAASDPCRNSVPSAHMRCRTTASLRATATMARRRPLAFISRMPQAFRLDHAIERMSMALAAA